MDIGRENQEVELQKVILDYFILNKIRIMRAYCIIYILFETLQIFVMFRDYHSRGTSFSVLAGTLSAIILAVIVALYVFGVSAADSYFKIRSFAKKMGLSINEYVQTEDYRQHGREKLKRTDAEPRWL